MHNKGKNKSVWQRKKSTVKTLPKEWLKYLNHTCNKDLISKIYKNSTQQEKIYLTKKMRNRPKQTFLKTIYANGQQLNKKVLNINGFQKNATRYHSRITVTKEAKRCPWGGETEPLHCASENVNEYCRYGIEYGSSLNNRTIIHSSYFRKYFLYIQRISNQCIETHRHTDAC